MHANHLLLVSCKPTTSGENVSKISHTPLALEGAYEPSKPLPSERRLYVIMRVDDVFFGKALLNAFNCDINFSSAEYSLKSPQVFINVSVAVKNINTTKTITATVLMNLLTI